MVWKKGQTAWNKGLTMKEMIQIVPNYANVGFQKGHSFFGDKKDLGKRFLNENGDVWNKGKKGLQRKNKTTFKIGNIPHNTGTPWSEEVKDKIRITYSNYIENSCKGYNSVLGKHENQILDELEKSEKIKIIRQYKICGYFIDGYCKKLNIAFEIDEPYHKHQTKKDIIRELKIKNELNCNFIRIKDNFI